MRFSHNRPACKDKDSKHNSGLVECIIQYFFLQDLVELAGPEEMKWPSKLLYTYNVRNGDKFIVDEKVPLARLRTTQPRSSSGTSPSPSPASKHTVTFQIAPRYTTIEPFKFD